VEDCGLPRLLAILIAVVSFWPTGCAHIGADSAAGDTNHSFYSRLIDLYSGPLDHFSAVRSGSCPMHPSCSSYARNALEQHGFFVGWMMAMDRLMRCGRDETRLAPAVWIAGRWKTFDPVSANDFWWKCRRRQLTNGK